MDHPPHADTVDKFMAARGPACSVSGIPGSGPRWGLPRKVRATAPPAHLGSQGFGTYFEQKSDGVEPARRHFEPRYCEEHKPRRLLKDVPKVPEEDKGRKGVKRVQPSFGRDPEFPLDCYIPGTRERIL